MTDDELRAIEVRAAVLSWAARDDANRLVAEVRRLRALLAPILNAGDYEGLALACAAARRALGPDLAPDTPQKGGSVT